MYCSPSADLRKMLALEFIGTFLFLSTFIVTRTPPSMRSTAETVPNVTPR